MKRLIVLIGVVGISAAAVLVRWSTDCLPATKLHLTALRNRYIQCIPVFGKKQERRRYFGGVLNFIMRKESRRPLQGELPPKATEGGFVRGKLLLLLVLLL